VSGVRALIGPEPFLTACDERALHITMLLALSSKIKTLLSMNELQTQHFTVIQEIFGQRLNDLGRISAAPVALLMVNQTVLVIL